MKRVFVKVKIFLKKWKDVFFDKTYLEILPKELIACVNRSQRLMIYFAIIMLFGLIFTAGSIIHLISCIGLCLLVELLLLVRFLTLKNDLLRGDFKVYSGKIVGSESPWWVGGKLNRKREKQVILVELQENGELIKCSLVGNVTAKLDDGSFVNIYAREMMEDDTGTLIVTSYYAIANPKKTQKKNQLQ